VGLNSEEIKHIINNEKSQNKGSLQNNMHTTQCCICSYLPSI